ncbi:MAG: hypothetical protein M1378_00145 [Bacteroidetes bacterium]|nr:hypothetical protein [Bacteroidota bacterium]
MDTPATPQKGNRIEYRDPYIYCQAVRGTVRKVENGKVYCNWDDGLFNTLPAPIEKVAILESHAEEGVQ